MATPAYGTVFKIPGTPTVFAGAATVCIDPGNYTLYRVSDATKRIWHPSTPPTVKVNGVAKERGVDYDYQPLDGLIGFYNPLLNTDVVTVDGAYLPLYVLAGSKEFSVSCQADMLDDTSFDSNGVKHKKQGLKFASGSVSGFFLLSDDADTTLGETKLQDILDNGTLIVVEVTIPNVPPAFKSIFRAYAYIETEEQKGSVDSLVESSFNWQSDADRQTFGWFQV